MPFLFAVKGLLFSFVVKFVYIWMLITTIQTQNKQIYLKKPNDFE